MAYTLQESYSTVFDGGSALASATYQLAQTFLAGSSYTLTKVELLLYREGTPPNLTVEIQSTSAGEPTNSVLATQSIDISGITADTAGEWVPVVFVTPYALTSGVTYAIVISDGWTDAANRVRWRQFIQYDNYAGGDKWWSTTDGATWTITNDDMGFKNYSGTSAEDPVLEGTIAGTGSQSGALTFATTGISGGIAGASSESGVLTFASLGLVGSVAGVGGMSGALSYEALALAGTIAAVAALSGSMLFGNIIKPSTITTVKRLIVAGNDQIWYESI